MANYDHFESQRQNDAAKEGERGNINILQLDSDMSLFSAIRRQSNDKVAEDLLPKLDLEVKGDTRVAQAETAKKVAKFDSKYDTGAELTTARELKQAGLDPKNVDHKVKEGNGVTEETTTVKYPNGLEVTVSGRVRHMPSGRDVVMDPDATVKEPLPKGFSKDKDGGILDSHGVKVAQINEDGTVTVKVGKDYLTQGPAGVREESGVIESKQGKGITGRIKPRN